MKPRPKPQENETDELFRSKLKNVINIPHELGKRPVVTVWTKSARVMMINFVDSLFVSTKRNRGHSKSDTFRPSTTPKEPTSNDLGATRDRGTNPVARSLGVESLKAVRRKREPVILLAKAISTRSAGKRNEYAASTRESHS
jgi:hypothetical protein